MFRKRERHQEIPRETGVSDSNLLAAEARANLLLERTERLRVHYRLQVIPLPLDAAMMPRAERTA